MGEQRVRGRLLSRYIDRRCRGITTLLALVCFMGTGLGQIADGRAIGRPAPEEKTLEHPMQDQDRYETIFMGLFENEPPLTVTPATTTPCMHALPQYSLQADTRTMAFAQCGPTRPASHSNGPRAQDPLANVPEPDSTGACDYMAVTHHLADQELTLRPGKYCGGIELVANRATIDFLPGTYVLAGGGLHVSGSDNEVTGDGVFFYNTDRDGDGQFGHVVFEGNDNIVLFDSASEYHTNAGPQAVDNLYYGILFWKDRSALADKAGITLNIGQGVQALWDGLVYWRNGVVRQPGRAKTPAAGRAGE